ncbi:mannonate dehydratase [Marinimicrobium agarilyticum]|uniref:mannonate dehydratase n=1 Tax=Marinimicrobium agarilyticum TaxID=306546 RepID=UPI00042741BA|nr:mannonate dehydratase [Marinimicrobium agarilyticum]
MQETWRWFGLDDPVTLEHILQAGATGVVTALHQVPTGDAWSLEDILERKAMIEAQGMNWAVVESVPLHNDIKTRSGNHQAYIENYKTSIRNLGKAGVTTLCYNFMPVVDWTRTNLSYVLPNRSQALRFEMSDFAAYDVHILQRANAAADYTPEVLARAQARFGSMSDEEKQLLEKNIIAGLPGGEGSYDRPGIKSAIERFIALGNEGMRANLFSFLREVVPVAEEAGVRLCIHPDDPPFSLFGLPRVVSTASDVRALLEAVPSEANGLTLCAGSYGARSDNDLLKMAEEFGPRIYFAHLRNVTREADGSFYEADHLGGDVNMVGLIDRLLSEEARRRADQSPQWEIPMRPDHGHLMADEIGKPGVNPGYSYGGRMKGLAELRGIIHALQAVRSQATG